MASKTLAALMVILALTHGGLAWAQYQVFSYSRDGKMRLCRGDTQTGEALCATGTGQAVTTQNGRPPRFTGTNDAAITWLRFPSPFTARGPELYRFLSYQHRGEARICVGNTATSQLICADGTASFAQVHGMQRPAFSIDGDRKIRRFRFFGAKPGKAGDFDFVAYQYDALGRACWFRPKTGETVCADGTPVFSRERAIDPARWRAGPGTTTWYRFFGLWR